MRDLTARSMLALSVLLFGLAGVACPGPDGDDDTADDDTADDDTADDDTADDDIPEMTVIESGTFSMGSPAEEVGHDDNEQLHVVTLTRDFMLSVTEITQRQFESRMGYNPSTCDDDGCGPDRPVQTVTWHEAAAYANELSMLEQLTPCYDCDHDGEWSCELDGSFAAPYDCEGYRLPTEAEWEFAARGGLEGAAFPNGGALQPGDEENCSPALTLTDSSHLSNVAWFCGSHEGGPADAGRLAVNGHGLFDMSGNVFEWCHDGYQSQIDEDVTDPWGDEGASFRVFRGGSWKSVPWNTRVAMRVGIYADDASEITGYRIARTVDP